MYVCVLASGSKGNCIYICDQSNTAILIDAGLSWKATNALADEKGINLNNVKAIIVTHEHIDHYKGASIISKRLNDIPIYFKKEVIDLTHKIIPENPLSFRDRLTIDTLKIRFFETTHDSLSPVGLLIKDKHDTIVGIATDLGKISKTIASYLKFSNILLIEANYDEDMLWHGDYPDHLKMRIASDNGHLSNEQTAVFVNSLDTKTTKHVVLCHTSEENNSITAIQKTFGAILDKNSPQIHIANQYNGSSLFCINNI